MEAFGPRIYREDCVAGMARRIPKGSVSVVVTSPPYNIAKPYHRYRDDRPRDDYLRWIGRVGRAVRRVLAEDGSFFLNVGGKPSDPWIPFDVAERLRSLFVLQNTIVWVKSIAVPPEELGGDRPRAIAIGHYKPVNSPRYLNNVTEFLFHFTHRGDVPLDKLAIGVPYKDTSNVRRWKRAGGGRRDRGNAWFVAYPTIHAARGHPTVFPPQLPALCLRLHGLSRIRLVLDPFVGSGSTAVAAYRLGLPFVGFEIDPSYVRLAREALRRAKAETGTPTPPLRVEGGRHQPSVDGSTPLESIRSRRKRGISFFAPAA